MFTLTLLYKHLHSYQLFLTALIAISDSVILSKAPPLLSAYLRFVSHGYILSPIQLSSACETLISSSALVSRSLTCLSPLFILSHSVLIATHGEGATATSLLTSSSNLEISLIKSSRAFLCSIDEAGVNFFPKMVFSKPSNTKAKRITVEKPGVN